MIAYFSFSLDDTDDDLDDYGGIKRGYFLGSFSISLLPPGLLMYRRSLFLWAFLCVSSISSNTDFSPSNICSTKV